MPGKAVQFVQAVSQAHDSNLPGSVGRYGRRNAVSAHSGLSQEKWEASTDKEDRAEEYMEKEDYHHDDSELKRADVIRFR